MERIAILGSGMAGFGAAHRFHTEGHKATLYEKRPYHGGHTASYAFDNGFTIDEGPHVSFTQVERIQKLLAESVDQKFESLWPTNAYSSTQFTIDRELIFQRDHGDRQR